MTSASSPHRAFALVALGSALLGCAAEPCLEPHAPIGAAQSLAASPTTKALDRAPTDFSKPQPVPAGLVWKEAVVEASSFLAADAPKRLKRRATIVRLGALRLGRTEPIAWSPTDGRPLSVSPWEVVVVEHGPAAVRTLIKDENYRVAVYLDEADLDRRPITTVELRPESDVFYRDGSFKLLPGAPVRLEPEVDGITRLTFQSTAPNITATGLVPSNALGVVYTPQPQPEIKGDWALVDVTHVLDAPSGTLIASLNATAAEPIRVRKHGLPQQGYQYAELVGTRFAVEGWIPLKPPPVGGGYGVGHLGGRHVSGMHLRKLPRDTAFYASPTGAQVGISLVDSSVRMQALEGDRRRIEIRLSRWGWVPMWIDKDILK